MSSNDRPYAILMGAGCPLAIRITNNGKDSPLIPDLNELTTNITLSFEENSKNKDSFLKVLCGLKHDGCERPDLECILSRIRALGEVVGNGEVRGLTSTNLDDLDKYICSKIVSCMDKRLPDKHTPYHILASWIGGQERELPIELFTTNYDLLMEQAFEDNRVPFFDGFIGVKRPFFDLISIEDDNLPTRWARLWKIHGSINWHQIDNEIIRANDGLPECRRVIHPSHLKYFESRRMPYLAMIDRLRSFYRKRSATLITLGYSFRDEHINDVIFDGMQSNTTSMTFGLLYGELSNYANAIKIALQRANLSLFSEDEAVIGTRRGSWLISDEPIEKRAYKGIVWEYPDLEGEGKEDIYGEKPPPNKVRFELGDFSKFGLFLSEIIGNESTRSEA